MSQLDWTNRSMPVCLGLVHLNHLMNNPIVSVDGHRGLVFEGEIPEAYCFVPEECVTIDASGVHVDEIKYIRSGWDVRNMRFSETADGQRLFPKMPYAIADLDAESVERFVERICLAHCA